MTMTSSHCDHGELEGRVEEMKPKVATIRRNLFGPVDHQQLQQDFKRLLCMSIEVAQQRWNFDFQSERPEAGAVEWEEVRWQDVPAFYRSCVVQTGAKHRPEAPVSNEGEEYLELRARGAFRGTKLVRRTSTPLGIKRKQAIITDFFTVKKRRFLHQKGSSRQ